MTAEESSLPQSNPPWRGALGFSPLSSGPLENVKTPSLTTSENTESMDNPKEKNILDVASEIHYIKRLRRDFRGHYNRTTDDRIKQGWARLVLSSSSVLHELRNWNFEEHLNALELRLTVAQPQQATH